MFETLPRIITEADLEAMSARERRVTRVTPEDEVARIEALKEREYRRCERAKPYVEAGGRPWCSPDGEKARVYFNSEFGPALGYYDADTDELKSAQAGVTDDEFAESIKAKLQ